MNRLGWLCVVLLGCPPPLGEPGGDDGFELEVLPQPLSGTVKGEPWNVLQSFAMGDEASGYELFFAPNPVTACESATALEEGVLTVQLDGLSLRPWGEGATNKLQLPEGASISTEGGGIDAALDVNGANVVGALVFDFDEVTAMEGEFTAPLCP